MQFFLKLILLCFLFLFLIYLLIPASGFPPPPPDAVQSREEGDSEDVSVKRAYFTDFTREEVLAHYEEVFGKSKIFRLPIFSYRLNYPPEEAQTLVRDQTRSTFLEEIVHPFRESFLVNGFEPKDEKDDVWYKGIDYRQKITVRLKQSGVVTRTLLFPLVAGLVWLLSKEWIKEIKKLPKNK